VEGGAGCSAHDEHRPARPDRGPPRPGGGSRALPRPCRGGRRRLGDAQDRYRRPLAQDASASVMSGVVLVTGAAGLVGGAVVSTLRKNGVAVLGLDLADDPQKGVVACDLRDVRRLAAITQSRELAAVVHCGAVSGPALYRDDPGRVARTNIESTVNLLELAVARGVPRFVFAS